MTKSITINNVTIGDVFSPKNHFHATCQVVDILEKRSMTTGEIVDYECIAKGCSDLTTNTFAVPFSTVVRYRIAEGAKTNG